MITNNKKEKGTFFVRIKLKDLFGFADQEKITYGWATLFDSNGTLTMMRF